MFSPTSRYRATSLRLVAPDNSAAELNAIINQIVIANTAGLGALDIALIKEYVLQMLPSGQNIKPADVTGMIRNLIEAKEIQLLGASSEASTDAQRSHRFGDDEIMYDFLSGEEIRNDSDGIPDIAEMIERLLEKRRRKEGKIKINDKEIAVDDAMKLLQQILEKSKGDMAKAQQDFAAAVSTGTTYSTVTPPSSASQMEPTSRNVLKSQWLPIQAPQVKPYGGNDLQLDLVS